MEKCRESSTGTVVYEDIETRRRYGSLHQAWRAHKIKETDARYAQGFYQEDGPGGCHLHEISGLVGHFHRKGKALFYEFESKSKSMHL